MPKQSRTEKQIEGHKRQGVALARHWKRPEFREKLVEVQKRLGYRNYPVKYG